MTPHDAKNTLDRLWDDVPVGTPPVADLVRGGKTMRRRARLRVAGGAAALTLAVVAGSTIVANTVFDNANPRPDGEVPAAVNSPTAPAGQRLVGVGRVVVAVPADWGTNELDLCGSPEVATVWFGDVNAPNHCLLNPYRGASLQFTTLDTDEGRQAARHATASTEVDGLEVRRGVFSCPATADCSFSPDAAPEYVVVPSEDVVITLFGPERDQDLLDAIADSVQILPEGYTTVPFVEGNNLAAWKTAIAEVGLVPEGALPECEDVLTPQPDVLTNAACVTNPRVRPDPAPGSVAALGATVTLFPAETLDEPVDPPTSDSEVGGLNGTWAVRALVGRDGQSLLVGPHADGLELTFEDGEMSGKSGCNTVFGTYKQDGEGGGDLVFPQKKLGSTLVGCDEPPLVTRLLDVRHVSGSGDVRYLHAANWMIIAELRRS